jgi:uncharacterized protein YcbX
MASEELITVGRVTSLWRYPVKSMLGQAVGPIEVSAGGLEGDRRFGVVYGGRRVATAKRPARWRNLLLLSAELVEPGAVRLRFPDGRTVLSGDPGVDKLLSEFLGEDVELRSEAPPGAELERATPEAVLEAGPEADVDFNHSPVAAGAPAGTFFDFSPVQLITTASLAQAGGFHPAGKLDAIRYRPNILIETSPDLSGFVENDWVGRQLHLGPEVVLDLLVPSPRCAVPTLRHGELPPDPDALRVPLKHNFVPIPLEGYGSAPCLGVHAGVIRGGRLSPGDEVRVPRPATVTSEGWNGDKRPRGR